MPPGQKSMSKTIGEKRGLGKKYRKKKNHFFCKKQKIFGAMFDPHKSTRDDKKD